MYLLVKLTLVFSSLVEPRNLHFILLFSLKEAVLILNLFHILYSYSTAISDRKQYGCGHVACVRYLS